jgi:hypothetical protein
MIPAGNMGERVEGGHGIHRAWGHVEDDTVRDHHRCRRGVVASKAGLNLGNVHREHLVAHRERPGDRQPTTTAQVKHAGSWGKRIKQGGEVDGALAPARPGPQRHVGLRDAVIPPRHERGSRPRGGGHDRPLPRPGTAKRRRPSE